MSCLKLNDATTFSLTFQIIECIKQIHSRGISHMDIKENNILVAHCSENEFNPLTAYLPFKLKLADFGISVNLG